MGPGTGPFDSAGNYREDWADDPSKWRKPGKPKRGDDLPAIVKNDEPPPNSNPLDLIAATGGHHSATGHHSPTGAHRRQGDSEAGSRSRQAEAKAQTQAQTRGRPLHHQEGRHLVRHRQPLRHLGQQAPQRQRHLRLVIHPGKVAGDPETLNLGEARLWAAGCC